MVVKRNLPTHTLNECGSESKYVCSNISTFDIIFHMINSNFEDIKKYIQII